MRTPLIALRIAADALGRAPGPAARLVAVLAVAVGAWIVLAVLASPFVQPRVTGDIGGVFISSANQGAALPLRYARQVEAIPGARYVAYQTVAVVTCNDQAPPVSINAWGGPGAEVQVIGPNPASPDAAERARKWMADPIGILIGTEVARQCHWEAGMGVSPRNMFTDEPIEFHVIGVRPPQKNPMADDIVIAHYDYLNSASPFASERDHVTTIVTGADDPHAAPALAARIEAAFAHDDPPVDAITMTEFQNGLARYGQAQYVLGWVMLAIFLCAALVLISVLAHKATQRRTQMALLQVLGFSRSTLLSSFALEGLFIVLAGVGLGIGAGLLILFLLPEALGQFFGHFAIPGWAWWGLPVWLAVLLVAALVIPSITVARLRPVDVRET